MTALTAPPLGSRHELDGRRLWLHRSGDGGPAVVFLPGASAVGLDYLNLHERVAERTTSVLYDRAGTGWSDSATLPRTAAEVATELHALLRSAGVPGPYVFVAHSLGGAFARRFLQLFPDSVAGVVYLDAFYEEWDALMPPNARLRRQPVPSPLLFRLIALFSGRMYRRMFATWPAAVRDRLAEAHRTVAWQRAGALERSDMPALAAELRAAGPVPDVPSTVVTGLRNDLVLNLMMSRRTLRALTAGKRALYDALAGSVKQGEHVVLADARHSTLTIEHPDEVVRAIGELWERVR